MKEKTPEQEIKKMMADKGIKIYRLSKDLGINYNTLKHNLNNPNSMSAENYINIKKYLTL